MRAFTGWIIAAAAVALIGACSPKGEGGGDAKTATEMGLGDPKAPVKVTEYASVTCPHCARFNEEVFPAFKAKYIDTGKVYYTFREFLTPPANVAAAGFLLARCAGKDKYFNVTDAIFHSQAELYNDPRGVLFRIGKSVGLTEEQVTACVQDEAGLKALQDRMDKGVKNDQINGTPSFLVNGKKLDGQVLAGVPYNGGEISLAQLDAALQPLVKK